MKYIDQFITFKSSGDILNSVGKFNNPAKEITEAMSIRNKVAEYVLYHPMEYVLIDLCAGNGLVGVVCQYTLPIIETIAFDLKNNNHIENVKNYRYFNNYNIHEQKIFDIPKFFLDHNYKIIIVSSHPCKTLAIRIVDIFLQLDSLYPNKLEFVLLPCCENKDNNYQKIVPKFIRKQLGSYESWCYLLYNKLINSTNRSFNICKDNYCLSPKNIIIYSK